MILIFIKIKQLVEKKILFKRKKKIESNVIDQLSRKQLILHRKLKKLLITIQNNFFDILIMNTYFNYNTMDYEKLK